ncbi:hypothetical protein Tco_0231755 [Tanacetum coccineum]
MVTYLKKLEGSEGFHQIVDFLNASHIRTLDNGEIEITATIDGKLKTFTEAFVRRHLQLADAAGISNLPTTKIFEQLALTGQENEVPQPSSPSHTNVANEAASTGVDDPSNSEKRNLNLDQDPTISLDVSTTEEDISTAKLISTGGVAVTTTSVDVSTVGAEISTTSPKVKTTGDFGDDFSIDTIVYIRRSATKAKDKGKGIMEESESAMAKTKRQQEQERLGLEIALGHPFNVEEMEDIKAKVEADEELAQRLQAEEREMFSKVEQARMLVELIN